MNVNKIYFAAASYLVSLVVVAVVTRAEEVLPEQRWSIAPAGKVYARAQVVPNAPALIKSLGDAAEHLARFQPPADALTAASRQELLRGALHVAIGLNPLPERTPLHARLLAQHTLPGYVIENITFESRPGFPVTANVYRSDSATGRRPAVLCPIGHHLSAGKTASDVQARCIQLAQLGFVVLSYDAIGQGERMVAGNIHHDAGFAILPLGETIAGWMIWDSMRALDYLQTREDVDPKRIGVTGNSGGGLNTLYTAALDERVTAAVVVGYTFEFRNLLKYGGTHCTCNHLPGLFRNFEWCDVAGLISPRPLMMIQGSDDGIFPISGARRAARNTQAWYSVQAASRQNRFVELAGQPHAYTTPFREIMYGWLALHLSDQGEGAPLPERTLPTLPEQDARLLCDPEQAWIPHAPSVVDIAQREGLQAIAKLPSRLTEEHRETVGHWVRTLLSPPDAHPHSLAPIVVQNASPDNGMLEKLSFLSEEGEYIPGLLWLPAPHRDRAQVILIVDSRGKSAVAESGWVAPLQQAGFAIFAIDLRGRGETLGRNQMGWDTNFRLVTNQILLGQPLPGRRAFDLRRALDYLETRETLDGTEVVVVGLHDDALPAILAAAVDERISRLAVSGYLHSFLSQMRCRDGIQAGQLRNAWNDPQLDGHLHCQDDVFDFGAVIPSALRVADVPDLLAFISPRPVLFCQARDQGAPEIESLTSRFRTVLLPAAAQEQASLDYAPDQPLGVPLLLDWLHARLPSENPSP